MQQRVTELPLIVVTAMLPMADLYLSKQFLNRR